MFVTGAAGRGVVSIGHRQAPLAPGPAGQMIAVAAVTGIGAQVDAGGLCRGNSVRLAGIAFFLAADAEAGAHGVNLGACRQTGNTHFPPRRAAVGRGASAGWWRGPSVVRLRQGYGGRHLPIASQRGGKCFGLFWPRWINLAACGGQADDGKISIFRRSSKS